MGTKAVETMKGITMSGLRKFCTTAMFIISILFLTGCHNFIRLINEFGNQESVSRQDWQTYSDPSLNLAFDYPSDWYIQPGQSYIIISSWEMGPPLQDIEPDISYEKIDIYIPMPIQVYDAPFTEVIDAILEAEIADGAESVETRFFTTDFGLPAVWINSYNPDSEFNFPYYLVMIEDHLIHIVSYQFGSGNVTSIVDDIVLTFRSD